MNNPHNNNNKWVAYKKKYDKSSGSAFADYKILPSFATRAEVEANFQLNYPENSLDDFIITQIDSEGYSHY